MTTCERYIGVACVNGACPIALEQEYQELGIPVVKNCEECPENKGCKDCALDGTEDCIKEDSQ